MGVPKVPTRGFTSYFSEKTNPKSNLTLTSSSIEPLQRVFSTLPENATVHVNFEDTAYNDYRTLAKTLAEEMPRLQPNPSTKIFTSIIPVGFFSQVVPSATVDLGVSWSSMTYLEHQPKLEVSPDADMSTINAARKAATEKAGKESVAKFLTLRAAEIKPGGYFVAAMGGAAPSGETQESNPGAAPLGKAMMIMIQNGKIAPQEAMKFASWPAYDGTTIEDLKELLAKPEMAALWEVEVAEPYLVEHPAWKTYQEALKIAGSDEGASDKAVLDYSRAIMTNLLASSGAFWSSILKHNRGEDWHGEDEFVNEMTEVAVEQCAKDFKDMRVVIWYNYLRLKRKAA